MDKMKREEVCKRIRDAFPNMIVDGQYKVYLYGEDISFIITELLQKPEKFDPIEHINNGHRAYSEEANLIIWEQNNDIQAYSYIPETPCEKTMYALLNRNDWKPYVEPEPTPQELIDKARSCMTEAFGEAHGTEIDDLNAVIDAFEKSLEEK